MRVLRSSYRLYHGALLFALATALLTMAAWSPALAQKKPSVANPYPLKGDSDPHSGVTAAKRLPVQGIDISKWQGEIDWQKVKAAGTRFAFIKATEGGDLLDDRFHENWREAKKAGVPRGAYHFVYWCRPAHEQMAWFRRNVPRDPEALPPVLDLEWNGHSKSCPRTVPRIKALAKIRTMLAAMEAHSGKKPIIYTDINFHADIFEGTTEFDDYAFWLRSVADVPSERYENRPWEFWQFTATGTIPGISGDVDRNAFFGTDKQFRDWIAGRYDIGARREIGGAAPKLAKPSSPKRDVNVTGSIGPRAIAGAAKTLPANGFRREAESDDEE
jgi:lysozyme